MPKFMFATDEDKVLDLKKFTVGIPFAGSAQSTISTFHDLEIKVDRSVEKFIFRISFAFPFVTVYDDGIQSFNGTPAINTDFEFQSGIFVPFALSESNLVIEDLPNNRIYGTRIGFYTCQNKDIYCTITQREDSLT